MHFHLTDCAPLLALAWKKGAVVYYYYVFIRIKIAEMVLDKH